MIVYLSHWDWNLYKSRKDIVLNLNDLNFTAICPEGKYTNELSSIYEDWINWEIERKKTFDIKGIINLKNIILVKISIFLSLKMVLFNIKMSKVN